MMFKVHVTFYRLMTADNLLDLIKWKCYRPASWIWTETISPLLCDVRLDYMKTQPDIGSNISCLSNILINRDKATFTTFVKI